MDRVKVLLPTKNRFDSTLEVPDEPCSWCRENLREHTSVRLPCAHWMGVECLREHVKAFDHCPICRGRLYMKDKPTEPQTNQAPENANATGNSFTAIPSILAILLLPLVLFVLIEEKFDHDGVFTFFLVATLASLLFAVVKAPRILVKTRLETRHWVMDVTSYVDETLRLHWPM